MKGKPWTFWDIEVLKSYYEADVSLKDLANILHRTKNAIMLKASRMGLKRPVLEVPTCPICGQQIPQETRP